MAGKVRKFDLSGKTFNSLIAIFPLGVRGAWLCHCICGNSHAVKSGSLRSGHTKSCGCRQFIKTSNGSWAKDGGWKNVISNIRNSIKGRGRESQLDYDEIKNLLTANCFYCGISPSTKERLVLRNGIDRINNDLGYVTSNVVPCCKKCNLMKGVLGIEEFLLHIESITRFQRKRA